MLATGKDRNDMGVIDSAEHRHFSGKPLGRYVFLRDFHHVIARGVQIPRPVDHPHATLFHSGDNSIPVGKNLSEEPCAEPEIVTFACCHPHNPRWHRECFGVKTSAHESSACCRAVSRSRPPTG